MEREKKNGKRSKRKVSIKELGEMGKKKQGYGLGLVEDFRLGAAAQARETLRYQVCADQQFDLPATSTTFVLSRCRPR